MKPIFPAVVALAVGIAIGFITTSKHPSPRALQLQAEAVNRAPRGFLVAESKAQGNMKFSVDLRSSFGANPGDPIKIYADSISAPIIGNITYSYPILETPRFGDIIIVRLELSDGSNNTYILRNGKYQVILETDKYIVSYSKNNESHKQRA